MSLNSVERSGLSQFSGVLSGLDRSARDGTLPVMKKGEFIYLIQSHEGDIPYRIPRGSDMLLLQWQPVFRPRRNSFHLPGSTWASGRNELYRRALEKGDYEYYVFLDDDIELFFDLREFEDLSRSCRPRRFGPCFTMHPWYASREGEMERTTYVDHGFVAVRADCSARIFPYTTRHDATCWWLASEDMCVRFGRIWPLETVRFNTLRVRNGRHRDYPRHDYPGLPPNPVRSLGGGCSGPPGEG